jgi:hypothetical protein
MSEGALAPSDARGAADVEMEAAAAAASQLVVLRLLAGGEGAEGWGGLRGSAAPVAAA